MTMNERHMLLVRRTPIKSSTFFIIQLFITHTFSSSNVNFLEVKSHIFLLYLNEKLVIKKKYVEMSSFTLELTLTLKAYEHN